MHKIISKQSIDWLEAKKIFFHYDLNVSGLAVGDKIYFNENLEIEPYTGFFGNGRTLCQIGSFSYSNSSLNNANISIGRYCSISWGLQFLGPRHPIEFISTSNFTYARNVPTIARFIEDEKTNYHNFPPVPSSKGAPVIENDVWIGQGVMLNDGITLGTGSVVAANSVVTRDVAPYSIVGGNPAKLIRMRFDQDVIAGLISTEWWKFKFTEFSSLPIHDPSLFIKEFSGIKHNLVEYLPKKIRIIDMP